MKSCKRLIAKRLSLAIIAIIFLCMIGGYYLLKLNSSAIAQERFIRMRETFDAIKRFDEWYGHLPRSHCSSNRVPLTSWRLDLLPMTIGVKHSYDVNESWLADVNAHYASLKHPFYCSSSTDTQIVAVLPAMRECDKDGVESLANLHPEQVLLIHLGYDSGIHWMAPQDPSLSEVISSISQTSVKTVFVLFADGQIWEIPVLELPKLREFESLSHDTVERIRDSVLKGVGERVNSAGGS